MRPLRCRALCPGSDLEPDLRVLRAGRPRACASPFLGLRRSRRKTIAPAARPDLTTPDAPTMVRPRRRGRRRGGNEASGLPGSPGAFFVDRWRSETCEQPTGPPYGRSSSRGSPRGTRPSRPSRAVVGAMGRGPPAARIGWSRSRTAGSSAGSRSAGLGAALLRRCGRDQRLRRGRRPGQGGRLELLAPRS